MRRKPAVLLLLMLAGVLFTLMLQRPSAADSELLRAYIPLAFANHPQPPSLSYFDDFSDQTRNWFVGSDDVVLAGHVDGEYHLGVRAGSTLVSVISPAEFGVLDYKLNVDVYQVSGEAIAYGLVLDWLNWEEYSVALAVPAWGRYALLRVSGGEAEDLIPWTATNLLTAGVNQMRVERWDTFFTLAINGMAVTEAQDLGYRNEQMVRSGLAVLAVGPAEATGGFDNFLLAEWRQRETAAHHLPPLEGADHRIEPLQWRPR